MNNKQNSDSSDLDLSSMRVNYIKDSLSENVIPNEPLGLFDLWFKQAMSANLVEPNAFILSTVSDNKPTSRTVLLKFFDASGFTFFTNYQSRKSFHLKSCPFVSLLFPWYLLERQVIVSGQVIKLSKEKSSEYFLARPRSSQLGAWVSKQSQVIESRSVLDSNLKKYENKFSNKQVPYPEFWGGFKVIPKEYEFWQGRENRLHDRFVYSQVDNDKSWRVQRLSP